MEDRAMNNKLSAAIDALIEQLAEQEHEVIETKKMINALCKRIGEEPRFVDSALETTPFNGGPLRRDQFYGKPLATAAQEYLERRKQACSAEEIMHGLEDGGFNFVALGWKEDDRLRSFAISLAKNNKAFHKLPNGTIGLPAWYPDVKTPKRTKGLDREKEVMADDKAAIPEKVEGVTQASEKWQWNIKKP
jgi:hypothetical protein